MTSFRQCADYLRFAVNPTAQNHRKFIVKLLRAHRLKRVAEIGVWRAELSRQIADLDFIESLLLVDPYLTSKNIFEHGSAGGAPSRWPDGCYSCTMGEGEKSQAELDVIFDEVSAWAEQDKRIELVRGVSEEACLTQQDESMDFVFIDAIHLYEHVLADIDSWWPKVRSGGILAGDDYNDQFSGIVKAVNERFEATGRLRIAKKAKVWWVKKQ